MKLLVILSLVLTIASAIDLREAETNSSSAVLPAIMKEGRIYNGETASEGQFPYQVAVISTLENYFERWCGGSLIGRQWVLTSAHCVSDVRYVIVHLGTIIRTNSKFSFKVSKRDFIIHPRWQKDRALNDIALIKIPTMSLTRTIQVVKLPARAGSHSSYKHKSAIVSGWGITSPNDVNLPERLRYAQLQVIGNTACKSSFGEVITAKMICANSKLGASICSGDSGSPLVLDSDKVLVGVTTLGGKEGCGYPSVFTRVTSYLDWIYINTGIAY